MRAVRTIAAALVVTLGAISPAAAGGDREAAAARGDEPELRLRLGGGDVLAVRAAPFGLELRTPGGRTRVSTATGGSGLRPPGVDGPQPAEPAGAAGAAPAMGFVVGAAADLAFPATFWTGNRLLGGEAGTVLALTQAVSARRTGRGWELRVATDVPGMAPARLSLTRAPGGGAWLRLRPPRGLRPAGVLFSLRTPPDEGLYGLGARKDAFDQRGRLRNVWVDQQNAGPGPLDPAADPLLGEDYTFPNGAQAAYHVAAQVVGSRGWCAWVADSELSRIDLAATRPDVLRWGVAAPSLRLFLAGGGIEEAVAAYTAASGRAPPPPRWAYEPWVDVINEGEGEAAPYGGGFSGGARVRADAARVVRAARTLALPVGVIGIEGWHALPGGARFTRGLRRKGFHLSAYWSPFIAPGHPKFEQASRRGYLVRTPTGDPYPLVTNRGNISYVVDFTHPGARRWWARQLRASARMGFEGFMHDFGEFVREGMVFADGRPPESVHNAYPVLYHRAARRFARRWAAAHPGFEPFFYLRAGYSSAGASSPRGASAATPAVFPGDETTDFEQGSGLPSVVPAMLNAALGGMYAFTTDVGGYLDLHTPRTTPELLVRWSQLAAFTPIMRLHNSTFNGSLYPWELPEPELSIWRRYARAKVALIDLVDRWSRRAARRGSVGPVRPLVLDDRSPKARSIDDQWLLGRDLLVAPVLEQGARSRSVYFPRGASWERVVVGEDGRLVRTGEVHEGGSRARVATPLADIGLFVRRGARGGLPLAPRRARGDP